ncbi:IS1182 family transposase [Sporomusa sphaeroides]|uniref:IS1182 family transposase n=1 Tax=Sporomusa sphaeroides TaxID=47679 RepID=UPI002C6004AB|nr:IS1182 family transposase [Sporomusa sphaeroides]HML33732.1 IS1182 family transposase [Sporomusa sphaeroides]
MDIGDMIPADDSVRLLSAVMERMDYSKLEAAYSRVGRIERSPKRLFKILVYGYMNGIYSSRKLEQACRRDVNFMYLLGREKVPDHATLARFRSERLTDVIDDLFTQLVRQLADAGELSLSSVFIDGTKLEANANRYSFVWKKSTQKHEQKLQEKMKGELPALAAGFGLRFYAGERIKAKDLKKLRKRLKTLQAQQVIVFVHGKGQRKTALQRAVETVEQYLARQKTYDDYNHSFGERNSFSKTDRDATFLRMKEDHMRNGQLKPGYNTTLAVDAEYIVGAAISQERSDSQTLIPMLKKLQGLGYTKPVADAGFESEENYTWCEENELTAFIKPSNHEKAKTRKYKSDIGRRENMPYDESSDSYRCHRGHPIRAAYEKKTRSKAGYAIVTTVYTCTECAGCPHKAQCIKGKSKTPLEERHKNLYVSKTFLRQRQQMQERIQSKAGILLRINRSIQVEGAFGVLKQDMGFRRFLMRGSIKVQTEFLLLCMGYNLNKLHSKIQNDRCGSYLHIPKTA